MGKTLAEKIWDDHIVRSAAGEPDLLYIDLQLIHEVTSAQASSVAKSVSAIPGVTLAEGVTGPYDVIMRAEAPSMEEFGRTILSKVQAVAGITRTLTCPVTY